MKKESITSIGGSYLITDTSGTTCWEEEKVRWLPGRENKRDVNRRVAPHSCEERSDPVLSSYTKEVFKQTTYRETN